MLLNRITASLAIVTYYFLRILPMPISRLCIFIVIEFYGLLRTKDFREIEARIRLSFPEKSDQEVVQITRSMKKMTREYAFEFLFARKLCKNEKLHHTIGLEDCKKYQNSRYIVMSCHFGSIEILGIRLSQLGFPNATFIRLPNNPYLQNFIIRHRQLNTPDGETIPVRKTRDFVKMLQVLKSGGSIGALYDQRDSKGELRMFLGQPALQGKSLVKLAVKHDVPIIMTRLVRERGKKYYQNNAYKMVFEGPLIPPKELSAEEKRIWLSHQIFASFEEWITENPEQYIWYSNTWKNPY